jgi:glycosyltransferase involved in cell wall biosynthesis
MLFVRDFLTDQTILRSAGAPARPCVSVVLPTYRRAKNGMLERSIASVLAQRFEDFELLVMDDGSTDGSYELIERFRQRDPRVVHVRHERNSGIHSVRLNEGIELSRGQYIAFQFDDDCWRENALQALVEESQTHVEPVVVFGRAHFVGQTWQGTLPTVAVNFVSLSEQNRIANNSVLIPRAVVDQHGMYDCHIGMRRLCDWDLWLRYVRHVPFVMIDDVISDVFEGNEGSLGKTVPWDLSLFRYLHAIPRDSLLTPECWQQYEIDALSFGGFTIDKDFRRRLYEQQIVPYYLKFRHYFPQVEGFTATLPDRQRNVIYASSTYESTQDIAFGHYATLQGARATFRGYYQPVEQIGAEWVREADAALLAKPVQVQAQSLAEQAMDAGVPLGVYLDDDLLTFHEFGPQFSYLAPGATAYQNLTAMLQDADTVWVSTPAIGDSVQRFNSRIIRHNGCVPEALLPEAIRPRTPGQPIKIGYVGNQYRLDEFKHIWDALLRITAEHQDQLVFEFWGLDVSSLPRLHSPVMQQEFMPSYTTYLAKLKEANFDILLTPMLASPRPRLGKAPSKYYQTAVAGALGIFSDVPQYADLPGDFTCLKPSNTAEAWYSALSGAITMPPALFDLMRRRMVEHVREEYTDTAQIHLHMAAWHATEFHAKTRSQRKDDGRPRVMYVLHSAHLGGGEIQLWRRLRLARQYAIEPIVVIPRVLQETPAAGRLRDRMQQEQIQLEFADYTCYGEPRSPADFRSDHERDQVRALLERCAPALVHSVTFIPTFGQVCSEMGLPHVASFYAIDESFAWGDGQPEFSHCTIAHSDSIRYADVWAGLLGTEKCVGREVTPGPVFALGQRKYLSSLGDSQSDQPKRLHLVVTGTVQARKSQLEIIEAVGRLSQAGYDFSLAIHGYTHFFPEYLEQCQARIRAYGLEDRVHFHGFSDDIVSILSAADVVLSLSTFESFPSAVKEAMAAGVLVVVTPVGGVTELIIDGVSGLLCADTSVEAMVDGIQRALTLTPVERQRITEHARRVARVEFHPQRAVNDLLGMYNRALDLTRTGEAAKPMPRSTPRHRPEAVPFTIDAPKTSPAGYVRIVRSVSYGLSPARAGWAGLDVLAITQGRAAQGRLTLNVYATGGQLIRQVAADLSGVHDHAWVPFRFPVIHNAAGRVFRVEFVLSEPGPQTVIALYETAPLEPKYRRAMRRLGLPLPGNALYCRMCYAR